MNRIKHWWRAFLGFFGFFKPDTSSFDDELTRNSPDRIYDELLNKFNITPDGHSFFREGFAINDSTVAVSYLGGHVEPLLKNFELAFSVRIAFIKNRLAKRLAEVEINIKDAAIQLDENDEKGYLYKVSAQISHLQNTEKELENILFPEKELQRTVEASLEGYKKTLEDVLDPDHAQYDPLRTAIIQKELLRAVDRLLTFFKNTLCRLSAVRHSLLSPPKLRYILGFYGACLFLLIAELAFSTTVVRNMVDMGFERVYPRTDAVFSVIYAIGMALSFAILFKFLIDVLMHRGNMRRLVFLLIVLLIFSFLTVVFSIDNRSGGVSISDFRITVKGLMLAFFSVSFGIANALLFREGVYLHHLRFRMRGSLKIGRLSRQKGRHLAYWKKRLQRLEELKAALQAALPLYDDQAILDIRQMIANLLPICRESFNRGHGQNIRRLAAEKQDLAEALFKKSNSNF